MNLQRERLMWVNKMVGMKHMCFIDVDKGLLMTLEETIEKIESGFYSNYTVKRTSISAEVVWNHGQIRAYAFTESQEVGLSAMLGMK